MPFVNTNIGTYGRFGNQFFRNMCAHFICQRNGLAFRYSMNREMNRLGFRLYHGHRIYSKTLCFFPQPIPRDQQRVKREIQSEEFMNWFHVPLNANIDLSRIYAQTREFSLFLWNYIRLPPVKAGIFSANPHRQRYGSNEEVFVHLRLGDAPQYNPGWDYYSGCLEEIRAQCESGVIRGWIASDSPDHPLCKRLIQEWGLRLFKGDEVGTIQFASTCQNIVLSNGSFSWLIGALAYQSSVYYPTPNTPWHGDIFVIPDWKERKSGSI